MKIAIGSDHAGYDLKEKVKKFLKARKYEVEDFGTNSNESVDYPDFAKRVSEAVLGGCDFGILICGSGIGMSMAANKFPGIRAAFCMSPELAKMSREHNNANILTLGARFVDEGTAEKIVQAFLKTKFTEEERHMRRIKKMGMLESVFVARK